VWPEPGKAQKKGTGRSIARKRQEFKDKSRVAVDNRGFTEEDGSVPSLEKGRRARRGHAKDDSGRGRGRSPVRKGETIMPLDRRSEDRSVRRRQGKRGSARSGGISKSGKIDQEKSF